MKQSIVKRVRETLLGVVRQTNRRPQSSRRTNLNVSQLEDRAVPALTIQFDYSLDTQGFFSDPARKAALEQAGNDLASRITTTLGAITPSGSNTWTGSFPNPATGNSVNVVDMTISAGAIKVFVGGRDLPDGQNNILAEGGPGSYSVSGTASWLDQVVYRGQGGDYSTWGGSISFDTIGVSWYAGSGQPSGNQADFYSVAMHELGHVLGFIDIAPSFSNDPLSEFHSLISGSSFTGVVSTFVNGGNPQLATPPVGSTARSHWESSVTWNGTPALMQSNIGFGVERSFSGMDYAALADIGWDLNMAIGSNGRDIITVDQLNSSTVRVTVNSITTSTTRTYDLTGPNIVIDAGSGHDTVNVNAGLQTPLIVFGGGGTDAVNLGGGSGNDSYVVNGSGGGRNANRVGDAVVYWDGDVEDVRIYGGAGDNTVDVNAGLLTRLSFLGGGGTDAVNLVGSPVNDKYVLNSFGGGRNAQRSGDAVVYWDGDVEDVRIYGGSGDDTVDVNAGLLTRLSFLGGGGTDVVNLGGGFGNDYYYVNQYGGGRNAHRGGDAVVYWDGGVEDVRIYGGPGNNSVDVNAGLQTPLTVFGGGGTDAVNLGGGSGNDSYVVNGSGGGRNANRVGDAVVYWDGDVEDVRIYGGAGDDTVDVNASLLTRLSFLGGGGTDAVNLVGSPVNDKYVLNSFGGGRNAQRSGDAVVYWDGDVEDVRIYGGSGDDTVDVNAGLLTRLSFLGGGGTDVVNLGGGFGNDYYYVNQYGGGRNAHRGGDAVVYWDGGVEDVRIYGGSGNNTFTVYAGLLTNLSLFGGGGNDTANITLSETSTIWFNGGSGTDTLSSNGTKYSGYYYSPGYGYLYYSETEIFS